MTAPTCQRCGAHLPRLTRCTAYALRCPDRDGALYEPFADDEMVHAASLLTDRFCDRVLDALDMTDDRGSFERWDIRRALKAALAAEFKP